jgi:L-ribulose-5-phosphate 4-epimerase
MGNERRLVAEAGRMLLQNGLVARTWGNVSCRTGKNSFVITPSGLSYDKMTEEDVVSYDMTTGEWIGSRKPSSEKGVHAAAYAQFPEVGFVIHTHQMFASAVGITGFGEQFLTDADYTALGGVTLASMDCRAQSACVKTWRPRSPRGAYRADGAARRTREWPYPRRDV